MAIGINNVTSMSVSSGVHNIVAYYRSFKTDSPHGYYYNNKIFNFQRQSWTMEKIASKYVSGSIYDAEYVVAQGGIWADYTGCSENIFGRGNIRYIGTDGFYEASGVSGFNFENVEYIGSEAFLRCGYISSGNFTKCVIMSSYAFLSCYFGTFNGYLPKLEYLGAAALKSCSISAAISFYNLKYFGTGALDSNSISSIYFYMPYVLSGFYNLPDPIPTIYVPMSLLSDYLEEYPYYSSYLSGMEV